MKLYPSKIAQLVNYIQINQVKALLLYGNDKGHIDDICKTIASKCNIQMGITIEQKLNQDELRLCLNARNFFGCRELIKFRISSANFNKDLKKILLEEVVNFPVFIIEDITSTSEIKKFFEAEVNLASIGCYYLEELGLNNFIKTTFIEAKKTINPEAFTYLTTNLHGDYQLLNNELEKLICLPQAHITLEDVINVITVNNEANGDDLCVYLIEKNLAKFLSEVEKLLTNNINEILIIRAMIRYYINLHLVSCYIQQGLSIDIACKKLSPPIFYKHLDNFKRMHTKVSFATIAKMLNILKSAEVSYKTNSHIDFMQIYLQAHKK